jgi:predicted ATPase
MIRSDYARSMGAREGAPTLPGPLRPRPAMRFVGRSAELAGLLALLDRAGTDGRQLALVGGEPGSGKTRLARELAQRAAAGGALVLYGACDPEVRAPYQPLLEALEPALEVPDGELIERAPGHLAALVTRSPASEDTSASLASRGGPEAERHRLHAGLTSAIAGLASAQGVVIVLDDLQWADPSSLQALRHLVRSLGASRVLLVAAFREGDGPMSPEVASLLAFVHRLDGVARIRLESLRVDDVADLIRDDRREAPEAERALAEQLVELTAGNAFLVGEVWRHVREGSAEVTAVEAVVPASVREVMGSRIAELTDTARRVVELVAASARGLSLPVLRMAAGIDDEALLSALDEGVRSGVLHEIPGPQLVHRVRHELLRRIVYDELSSFRRATMHLRIGEALEAAPGVTRDRVVDELAVHFRAAAPVAGTAKAVGYALAAAALAERSVAFTEAAEAPARRPRAGHR